jgi:Tol biopolymer transport system component
VGGPAIEDRDVAGGFSRRLMEGYIATQLRWSPDGSRILFTDRRPIPRLVLANASGGQAAILDSDPGRFPGASWSPDGQWIAYLRGGGLRKGELVKTRPTPGAVPISLAEATGTQFRVADWSPSGEWIVYPIGDWLALVSPDGKSTRRLTSRKFATYGFSREGGTVYGILQNTAGEGNQWQLYGIDVQTGAEKLIAPVHLPVSTGSVLGFSVHPDGKRFLTSIAKWPYDIWMLEGFDQAPASSWLTRLLHR